MGPAQLARFFLTVFGMQVIHIHIVGLEHICMRGCLADFHTYIAEHFYQYVNILYVGNIAYFNLAIGQKHGAYHLKSFVFRALRGYFARKIPPLPVS